MIKLNTVIGTVSQVIEVDENDVASLKQNGPFTSTGSSGRVSETYTTTIKFKSGGTVTVDEGSQTTIQAAVDDAKRKA